jgi:hypothetical protein
MGYGGQNPLLFHGDEVLRLRLLQDRDFAARVHGRISVAEEIALARVNEGLDEVTLLSNELEATSLVEFPIRSEPA